MYWFRFRRTSAWAGSVFKVFFFNRPVERLDNIPGNEGAIGSYTRAQLEAFVEAGKAALAAWPKE